MWAMRLADLAFLLAFAVLIGALEYRVSDKNDPNALLLIAAVVLGLTIFVHAWFRRDLPIPRPIVVYLMLLVAAITVITT